MDSQFEAKERDEESAIGALGSVTRGEGSLTGFENLSSGEHQRKPG